MASRAPPTRRAAPTPRRWSGSSSSCAMIGARLLQPSAARALLVLAEHHPVQLAELERMLGDGGVLDHHGLAAVRDSIRALSARARDRRSRRRCSRRPKAGAQNTYRDTATHSLTRSLTCSLNSTQLTHSLNSIHSLTQLNSLTHSLSQSDRPSVSQSLTHSVSQSVTHPPTHSVTQSLSHSATQSLTHTCV